jgi:hypothetical protein
MFSKSLPLTGMGFTVHLLILRSKPISCFAQDKKAVSVAFTAFLFTA